MSRSPTPAAGRSPRDPGSRQPCPRVHRSPWPLALALLALVAAELRAQPVASAGRRYPSLTILGFSDLNFVASDGDGETTTGFEQGQFVLHFASPLSATLSFFAELSVNADSESSEAELERVFVKYSRSDRLKLSFGRFHTQVNWWNRTFHHGQWLQTTVSRPEMTEFGGEFIPVHFVGAIAEGDLTARAGRLSYVAGIGNGRGEDITKAGAGGDANASRAWLAGISSRPVDAVELGTVFYRDRISRDDLAEEFDESIAAFYLASTGETPELITEYARLERRGKTSGDSFDSNALYAQVAYRIPRWGARLKPYGRYERINVAVNEPVFEELRDRQGYLVGVRIDVASLVAVKAEHRHQRSGTEPYADALFFQVSLAF